jgi:medium-chain acyl-[acyl-carrier-protein] hydrolase
MTGAAQDPAGWFHRPAAAVSPELRLVCFPYAGAGPQVFRGWTRLLLPGVELCAVALPGRAARLREAPRDRLGPLADDLTAALLDLPPAPYAFFGHSFGGLLAFEVARRLHRRGAPLPRHLFLSACPPPHLPPLDRDVHRLSDSALKERLEKLGGTPLPVLECPELLDLLLPALRADLEAFETHLFEPGPPLPVPMTVLGGAGDRMAGAVALEQWAGYTSGSFDVRLFPGGHFFLHSDEDAVVASVAGDLARHVPAGVS